MPQCDRGHRPRHQDPTDSSTFFSSTLTYKNATGRVFDGTDNALQGQSNELHSRPTRLPRIRCTRSKNQFTDISITNYIGNQSETQVPWRQFAGSIVGFSSPLHSKFSVSSSLPHSFPSELNFCCAAPTTPIFWHPRSFTLKLVARLLRAYAQEFKSSPSRPAHLALHACSATELPEP